MTLHLSFPSSTLGKLKKARGALEPLLQLLEFSVCAACLCTVCMCVRYVCQAVLICMVLLARRASPNGQKTKERDRMATHTVQPGCWAHFTPPSPWKPSTGSAWRATTNLTVEERVRLHPGRRVGRQKEPLSLLILQQKKAGEKSLPQYFCSWQLSLTWKQCEGPTKTSMNSQDQKIIWLSVCLLLMRDAIHTFQLLFISAIAYISSAQCAVFVHWIRPIVCANFQLPVSWSLITLPLCMQRNLFQLFYCSTSTHYHYLPFFYTTKWNKWLFSSAINVLTHCWHMDKRELLIGNTFPATKTTRNVFGSHSDILMSLLKFWQYWIYLF